MPLESPPNTGIFTAMEPTTYTYSKFYGWLGVIFFGFFLSGFVFISIICPDNKVRLFAIGISIILIGLLYYVVRWVFIPALNSYVALEMDEDKVYCYINDRTIYWKDVIEISEDFSRYSSFIKFDMIDDSTVSIPTKWITGRNKEICAKMQEYFARTI